MNSKEFYKDGKRRFKIQQKIRELRLRWYDDCDGVTRTYWQGGWHPWHEVMKIDKRLEV